jgi:hypothetical protein
MYEIINIVIFSLCIILFFHYLYNYLLRTYTMPVTKDIIGIQTQKYKNIINTMNKEVEKTIPVIAPLDTTTTSISSITQMHSMEDDLLQHALNEI